MVKQDNSLDDLLQLIYEQCDEDHDSLFSISKLKKLFCQLLEASAITSGHVYIIVDGLDELPDAERQSFLSILKILRTGLFRSITEIFVASRNLSDIRKGVERPKPTVIQIEGKNTDDIRRYIASESQRVVEELELEDEEPNMRQLIFDSLCTRADGNINTSSMP